MKTRPLILCTLFAGSAWAQLTIEQRTADFQSLADLYARRYAPLQWKQKAIQYDLLDMRPWLPKVEATTDDMSFYEVMAEYVAALQDAHDLYQVPSDFEAHLGFTVDIYDGKVLIDSVDRTSLSTAIYPFQVGDQLISVDGTKTADLMALFSKYISGGNPRTLARFAAGLITDRYQGEYPRTPQIGDTAAVVIQRQSGALENYSIPWKKLGMPLLTLGASPGPIRRPPPRGKPLPSGGEGAQDAAPARPVPFYQQLLQQYHHYVLPGKINVVGFDRTLPVFAVPAGFTQRVQDPSFFSGVYTAAGGTRIGYLRIADFEFPPLDELDTEVQFFQANTDVLIVDVMRNPGGDICAAEDVLSRLTAGTFQGAAAQMHPDWSDILNVEEALSTAQAFGADADTVAQLQLFQKAYMAAFIPNATNTPALPICGSTLTRNPVAAPYTKPVLMLVDDVSASAAEMFAAIAQDNHIATLFGYRTVGAGGSPEPTYVGINSEGSTTVTRSLVVRAQPVVTPDYPTTSYIENVGVRPDSTLDYMTTDNLLNNGSSFVSAFTAAAVALAKPTH